MNVGVLAERTGGSERPLTALVHVAEDELAERELPPPAPLRQRPLPVARPRVGPGDRRLREAVAEAEVLAGALENRCLLREPRQKTGVGTEPPLHRGRGRLERRPLPRGQDQHDM